MISISDLVRGWLCIIKTINELHWEAWVWRAIGYAPFYIYTAELCRLEFISLSELVFTIFFIFAVFFTFIPEITCTFRKHSARIASDIWSPDSNLRICILLFELMPRFPRWQSHMTISINSLSADSQPNAFRLHERIACPAEHMQERSTSKISGHRCCDRGL